jgi:hypothetical protein
VRVVSVAWILVSLVFTPQVFAVLLSNLNRDAVFIATAFEKNEWLVERRCRERPANAAVASRCPVRGFPISLLDFRTLFLVRWSVESVPLRDEWERLAFSLAENKKELIAAEASARNDWSDAEFKRGLVKTVNQLSARIEIQEKRKNELRLLLNEDELWQELFGPKGLVNGEAQYELLADANTFASLRAAVKIIDPIFLKSAGTHFGKNTWFDVEDRKIYWLDSSGKTWEEGNFGGPEGYGVAVMEGAIETRLLQSIRWGDSGLKLPGWFRVVKGGFPILASADRGPREGQFRFYFNHETFDVRYPTLYASFLPAAP